MKTMLKQLLPWSLGSIALYYLVPWILPMAMPEGAMLMMLLLLPFGTVMIGAIYGIVRGFHVIYPVSVALIFLPSVFLFYNETAIIYVFAYGILALIANLIGNTIHRLNQPRPRQEEPEE